MSKNKNIAVPLIGGGIILAALAVILFSLFAPRMAAKRALREARELLAETAQFSYVTVFNPLDHSSPLLPTDREVRLVETEEIEEMRASLLGYAEGARYRGVEAAESGNWDIRVRFVTDEGKLDLYLHADYVYLSEGMHRYMFEPQDAADYAAWRTAMIRTLLGAEA
jgi:hypothetical protein